MSMNIEEDDMRSHASSHEHQPTSQSSVGDVNPADLIKHWTEFVAIHATDTFKNIVARDVDLDAGFSPHEEIISYNFLKQTDDSIKHGVRLSSSYHLDHLILYLGSRCFLWKRHWSRKDGTLYISRRYDPGVLGESYVDWNRQADRKSGLQRTSRENLIVVGKSSFLRTKSLRIIIIHDQFLPTKYLERRHGYDFAWYIRPTNSKESILVFLQGLILSLTYLHTIIMISQPNWWSIRRFEKLISTTSRTRRVQSVILRASEWSCILSLSH